MNFPNINPVMFTIGPLQLRWYGFMYVLGFVALYFLVKKQLKEQPWPELEKNFDDLNLLLIVCVVLGGRIGYVVFYNLSYYLNHPLEILATWKGGMSFHGACLTTIVAAAIFSKRRKLDFWRAADLYAVTFPVGLGLGRLGNFINGELYGRVTTVSWGMVFPGGGPLPRHPSQLYEVFLEGFCLFLLLWSQRKRPYASASNWPKGSLLCLFLIGYGVARISVEFFRQPDAQLGFLWGGITMGQLLSLLMIIAGTALWGLRRSGFHTNFS